MRTALLVPILYGKKLRWLFRDEFAVDAAAPLGSPLPAAPGPGSWVVTDTENKLSRSGGKLVCAGGKAAPAFGDPGIWGPALTRRPGIAMVSLFNFTGSANYCQVGFDADQANALGGACHYFEGGTLSIVCGSETTSGSLLVVTGSGQVYKLCTVVADPGALFFIKGGAFTEWTLAWKSNALPAATLYPALSNFNAAFNLDMMRVLQLPAPFNSGYGIATARMSGARAQGDAFVHPANCLAEWIATTLPSSGSITINLRKADVNNYWSVVIAADGSLTLNEVNGGVTTARGSAAAGTVANGHRCVVVCDGQTLAVWSNGTRRIYYASAANAATATAGEIASLGTGGAVADLVVWPRTLAGNVANLLDRAVL